MSKKRKAIILLSGGIDSAVILAIASQQEKKDCYAISFDYGQRHRLELFSAAALCRHFSVSQHKVLKIPSHVFGDSGLMTKNDIPRGRNPAEINSQGIPTTYVPARNTLFIAYAIGQAEILEAESIYYGATKMDEHAYPDCRPEYIQAFQQVINLATKQAVTGQPPILTAPLLQMTKTEIIQKGAELKVPFELTLSCYDPSANRSHCGLCDACTIRREGFIEADISDPTTYSHSAK